MEPVTGINMVNFDTSSLQQQYGAQPLESLNGELAESSDTDSLGDKFFEILSDTKNEISQRANGVKDTLNVSEVGPMDLLKLQWEIAEISMQQELISKGVSKSTQNVDTLLKAQ